MSSSFHTLPKAAFMLSFEGSPAYTPAVNPNQSDSRIISYRLRIHTFGKE